MKNTLTALISFFICFFIFSTTIAYPLFSKKYKEQTVLKREGSVAYSPLPDTEKIGIKITVEGCAAAFLITVLPKTKTVKTDCITNESTNANPKKDYSHSIDFTLKGFENTVNFLGGVEIETPYGLPSPANTSIIIAKDEKLFVYGASLGALLTKAAPSPERLSYYCYALGELCLKFIKEGDPELYKVLNQNSKTDISYTDYYDNYKYLKEAIKYADID